MALLGRMGSNPIPGATFPLEDLNSDLGNSAEAMSLREVTIEID